MEKLVRFRKAFYEKQNDLQNGNKRKDRPPQCQSKLTNFQKSHPNLSSQTKKSQKPTIQSNTLQYYQIYGQDLLTAQEYQNKPRDFLVHHAIDQNLRARMLDWMVQVTSSYKFSHKTYFDGVNLMDRYFEAQKESLPPNKLHLIGVQCMLIASKLEEVYPLKTKTVFQKIAHRKLGLEELIETQNKIMKQLDYKLNSWSFFDLAMLKITSLLSEPESTAKLLQKIDTNTERANYQEQMEVQVKKLEDLCSYLCKFVLYNYEFYMEHSNIIISESIVKSVCEIVELQPPQSFFTESLILIELCKQKILDEIKNYQVRFGGLNNIFKFTKKQIICQVNKFIE